VAEAAAILQVPEGTVKSRCARGRARLAALLGYLRNPEPERDVPSKATGATAGDSDQGGKR
jgi:RNA polymerase sigma-70 factor (ECF subfamily)